MCIRDSIYVTANIIAHDENFEGLDEFLMALQDAGVRGIKMCIRDRIYSSL